MVVIAHATTKSRVWGEADASAVGAEVGLIASAGLCDIDPFLFSMKSVVTPGSTRELDLDLT
jgi:hypothetical protein